MRIHRHKPVQVSFSYGTWVECEKCGEHLDEPVSFFRKTKNFCVTVVKTAVNKIKWFFQGVYQHAEAIAILVLASLGLNALMGELPFIFMLPLWIEAPFVIPVLSVTVISLIVKIAEWRAIRRDSTKVFP